MRVMQRTETPAIHGGEHVRELPDKTDRMRVELESLARYVSYLTGRKIVFADELDAVLARYAAA